MYYFIATPLSIWFNVTVEQVQTDISNPTFKIVTLGLEIAGSIRSTGTQNRIFKRGAMKKQCSK